MRDRTPRPAGFTYMEVTITVLVIGIIAGTAAPSYFTAIASYQVEMAAKRIINDLEYARSEAQRKSQNQTVQFDSTTDSYTLVGVSDINASANAYVVALGAEPFTVSIVSASFGGDGNVIFDMYGRPDSNGGIVIQSGAEQRNITLGADGAVTVL